MENTTKDTPPAGQYEKYDKQLKDWSDRLSKIKGQISGLAKDAQDKANTELNSLETKYNRAKAKVREFKDKGPQIKDEMRSGFDKSMKDLSESFDNIKKMFH